MAFDTLRTARDLEASGFDRKQAEALANAIRSALTKKTLEAALANLKSDLGREFIGMESRLTNKLAVQQRWYVGLLFVAAGLAVAAMKLI